VIHQLAGLTQNPLVFLRWVTGFLRTQDVPPADGWATDAALQSIISTAAPVQGFDRSVVSKVVAVIDGLPRWSSRQALQGLGDKAGFTGQDIEDLEKLGLLVPRYRFRPEGEIYLEPVFNLLRPSVREKLRG
jgi:hypothetical protein